MSNNYFLLRLIQRPPRKSEIKTNAIATQVKTVLSVAIPMVKKVIPRIRNMLEYLRLFWFIDRFHSSTQALMA